MARPKDPSLRQRLVESAAVEFAERGFAAASMAGIGTRAGVTKGGVYFHFRSKEELFFAAVDAWRSSLRSALDGAGEAADGARALRHLLVTYLDYHFRHRPAAALLRMLSKELQGHFTAQVRDDLRTVFRGLRARIRELLVVGERDGSLYASDPASAAFLLAAGLEGIIAQWLASERDVEPFCHAESLADGLLAPYATGGRAAAAPESGREEPFPPF